MVDPKTAQDLPTYLDNVKGRLPIDAKWGVISSDMRMLYQTGRLTASEWRGGGGLSNTLKEIKSR